MVVPRPAGPARRQAHHRPVLPRPRRRRRHRELRLPDRLRHRRQPGAGLPLRELRAGLRRHARRAPTGTRSGSRRGSTKTAMVMCDLHDVDDRRADRGRAAHGAAPPGGGRRRSWASCRWWPARSSSTSSTTPTSEAHAKGYRDLRPHSPWLRGLPHPADDQGRVRHRRRSAAGSRPPACRSSSARARPVEGQHEINLDYTTAVEMADRNTRLQERGQGDRRTSTAASVSASWRSATSPRPARRATSTPACGRLDGETALFDGATTTPAPA